MGKGQKGQDKLLLEWEAICQPPLPWLYGHCNSHCNNHCNRHSNSQHNGHCNSHCNGHCSCSTPHSQHMFHRALWRSYLQFTLRSSVTQSQAVVDLQVHGPALQHLAGCKASNTLSLNDSAATHRCICCHPMQGCCATKHMRDARGSCRLRMVCDAVCLALFSSREMRLKHVHDFDLKSVADLAQIFKTLAVCCGGPSAIWTACVPEHYSSQVQQPLVTF